MKNWHQTYAEVHALLLQQTVFVVMKCDGTCSISKGLHNHDNLTVTEELNTTIAYFLLTHINSHVITMIGIL